MTRAQQPATAPDPQLSTSRARRSIPDVLSTAKFRYRAAGIDDLAGDGVSGEGCAPFIVGAIPGIHGGVVAVRDVFGRGHELDRVVDLDGVPVERHLQIDHAARIEPRLDHHAHGGARWPVPRRGPDCHRPRPELRPAQDAGSSAAGRPCATQSASTIVASAPLRSGLPTAQGSPVRGRMRSSALADRRAR